MTQRLRFWKSGIPCLRQLQQLHDPERELGKTPFYKLKNSYLTWLLVSARDLCISHFQNQIRPTYMVGVDVVSVCRPTVLTCANVFERTSAPHAHRSKTRKTTGFAILRPSLDGLNLVNRSLPNYSPLKYNTYMYVCMCIISICKVQRRRCASHFDDCWRTPTGSQTLLHSQPASRTD